MSDILYDSRTSVTQNVVVSYPDEEAISYTIYYKNQELTELPEKDILFIRDSINKLLKK